MYLSAKDIITVAAISLILLNYTLNVFPQAKKILLNFKNEYIMLILENNRLINVDYYTLEVTFNLIMFSI